MTWCVDLESGEIPEKSVADDEADILLPRTINEGLSANIVEEKGMKAKSMQPVICCPKCFDEIDDRYPQIEGSDEELLCSTCYDMYINHLLKI